MIDLSTMQYDGVRLITPVGSYHSFQDLRLMQTSDFEITAPIPKTHIIEEVWGVDSNLDFTEAFGPVRFENRIITLKFDLIDKGLEDWWLVSGCIYNALHGRYVQLIFDSDEDYYWYGLCSVNFVREERLLSHIQLVIDAFPYKRTRIKMQKKITVGAGKTVTATIRNYRMPSAPTIITTADAMVTYDTNTYNLLAGENKADFEFLEGTTEITFKGGGNVLIEWEGGKLL